MLPTFEKWTFYEGLYGENDGPSILGKWREKHIFINYNQMRAYVKCSPNQSIKKIMPYQPFHRAIDETLKSLEKCMPFLCLNLPEYNFAVQL